MDDVQEEEENVENNKKPIKIVNDNADKNEETGEDAGGKEDTGNIEEKINESKMEDGDNEKEDVAEKEEEEEGKEAEDAVEKEEEENLETKSSKEMLTKMMQMLMGHTEQAKKTTKINS